MYKTLIKTTPWKFQTGVELTWQPPNYDQLSKIIISSNNLWDEDCTALDNHWYTAVKDFKAIARQSKLPNYNETHSDCGHCIEYATPILRSWKDLDVIWHKATAVAKKVGLRPSAEGATTGMGHIHVGGLSTAEKVRALRDISGRPYVSWALVHPSDDVNAVPMMLGVPTKNDRPYLYVDGGGVRPWYKKSIGKNPSESTFLPWRKCFIFRCDADYNTLEWRAFDSAENWGEQVAHMALVQRYFSMIRAQDQAQTPMPKLPCAADRKKTWVSGWTLDQSVKGWRTFISDLGLPAKPYEIYIERNMEPRFEWGNRLESED